MRAARPRLSALQLSTPLPAGEDGLSPVCTREEAFGYFLGAFDHLVIDLLTKARRLARRAAPLSRRASIVAAPRLAPPPPSPHPSHSSRAEPLARRRNAQRAAPAPAPRPRSI